MYAKIITYLYVGVSLIFLAYVFSASTAFPPPARDFLQSDEPADMETPLRRAYFTNLTREEVIGHYNEVYKNTLFGFVIPNIRLNYPPEEAKTIIRDQTRSTFLEELVHPFVGSIYINGFEPKLEKDKILINGQDWRQKIIIRYVPSARGVRVIIAFIVIAILPLLVDAVISLYREYSSLVVKKLHKK